MYIMVRVVTVDLVLQECFFGLTELLDFVDPHSSFDVHTFPQNGWLDENALCFTICKLHIHVLLYCLKSY
jgi:hypothetical protein